MTMPRIIRRNTKLVLRTAIVVYFLTLTWLLLTVWRNDDDDNIVYVDDAELESPEVSEDERSVVHHRLRHGGVVGYLTTHDKLSLAATALYSSRPVNFSQANLTLSKYKPLYSDKIINPHPFRFTITNHNACTNATQEWAMPLHLLILVKSRPEDIYDRQQIRQTWGGTQNISNQLILTMFLLGQTPNATVTKEVLRESLRFKDIIQENFLDAYTNLTYKTMMGMRWMATFCPFTSFVASVDSDIILNLHNFVERLADKPRNMFAEGSLKTNWTPFRDSQGPNKKWYTPVELYPEPTYPPFFPGGCYVMSADVAATIYRESVHVRFLPWDDVFVGLVMQRAGITPRNGKGYQVYVSLSRRNLLTISIRKGIAVIAKHHSEAVDDQLIKIYQKAMRKKTRGNNIPIRQLVNRTVLYRHQGLLPHNYDKIILRYQQLLKREKLDGPEAGRYLRQPQVQLMPREGVPDALEGRAVSNPGHTGQSGRT